jgi:hypothetical protein
MAGVGQNAAGRGSSRGSELADRIKVVLLNGPLIPSEIVKRLGEDGFSKTTVLRALERLAREGEIGFAPAEPGAVGRSNPKGHYLLSAGQRADALGKLRQRPVNPQLSPGCAIVFAQCRSVQVADLLRVTAASSVTRHVAWVCRIDGELNGFLFGLNTEAASSESDRLVRVLADVGVSATTSIVRESLSAIDFAAQAREVGVATTEQSEATNEPIDLQARRPRRAESSPHTD